MKNNKYLALCLEIWAGCGVSVVGEEVNKSRRTVKKNTIKTLGFANMC